MWTASRGGVAYSRGGSHLHLSLTLNEENSANFTFRQPAKFLFLFVIDKSFGQRKKFFPQQLQLPGQPFSHKTGEDIHWVVHWDNEMGCNEGQAPVLDLKAVIMPSPFFLLPLSFPRGSGLRALSFGLPHNREGI
jgi:hypothetical protein